MFQKNFLLGMLHAGLAPSAVISARLLRSFPHERRLWVSGNNARLSDELGVDLVPFFNVTPLKQFTIGLLTFLALLRWGWRSRRIKNKVILTYNLSVPPGAFTMTAARLIGAHLVGWLADINVPGHLVASTPASRFDFWLHKRLIPRLDGIVAITDKIISDFAPGKPYILVEGGVSEQVLEKTGPLFREPCHDNFTITSASTLTEINGIDTILKAFALLEGDHYRLRIAGKGPLEPMVRDAAASDSRIEFLGFLRFEEVLACYNSSHLLVSMRPTKGVEEKNYVFPSKMMEYLSSGVPVIATCTGHTEAEFSEMTYLLRDETPEGLAALIRHVAGLLPEARAAIGALAREHMAAKKTWEAQSQRIARFLRDIVAMEVHR